MCWLFWGQLKGLKAKSQKRRHNRRRQPAEFHLVFTRMWLRYVRVFAIANQSVCLFVTLVHPTQGVEAFSNIFSPLCTLAILWPPCRILRRSSYGIPSIGGIKRKRGRKIERWWTYRRLYLINGTRYGLGYN